MEHKRKSLIQILFTIIAVLVSLLAMIVFELYPKAFTTCFKHSFLKQILLTALHLSILKLYFTWKFFDYSYLAIVHYHLNSQMRIFCSAIIVVTLLFFVAIPLDFWLNNEFTWNDYRFIIYCFSISIILTIAGAVLSIIEVEIPQHFNAEHIRDFKWYEFILMGINLMFMAMFLFVLIFAFSINVPTVAICIVYLIIIQYKILLHRIYCA